MHRRLALALIQWVTTGSNSHVRGALPAYLLVIVSQLGLRGGFLKRYIQTPRLLVAINRLLAALLAAAAYFAKLIYGILGHAKKQELRKEKSVGASVISQPIREVMKSKMTLPPACRHLTAHARQYHGTDPVCTAVLVRRCRPHPWPLSQKVLKCGSSALTAQRICYGYWACSRFLETIILPIPIELILIPLMAANKQRIWLLATITTLGCLIASLVGYSVGLLLFTSVGTWFINVTGMQESFQAFQLFFNQYGFAAIIAMGILLSLSDSHDNGGHLGYPVLLFLLAALIARGLRYYGLAWLVYRFGNRVLLLWKRHALFTSLIGGVIVLLIALATSTHALDDVTDIKQKTREVASARCRNPAQPWQSEF